MRLIRKFYDQSSGENGGQPQIPEEVQKELHELREFKAKVEAPQKTEEDIRREQELEAADFRKAAIEQSLMTEADFRAYETLTAKENKDIVFESFLNEFKEDHPDIQDEEELIQTAKEAFTAEYKLNSDNEKERARGLAKLEREAGLLKNPIESKFKSAKSQYTEQVTTEKTVKEKLPAFNKLVDEVLGETVPDKKKFVTIQDEEESVDIEADITAEQKQEIEKIFRTPKYFQMFLNGKAEEVKAAIQKKIDGFIKLNNFDTITKTAYELGKGVEAKRSAAHRTNPFPMSRTVVGANGELGKDVHQTILESHRSQKK